MSLNEKLAFQLVDGLLRKLRRGEEVDVDTQVNIISFAIDANMKDVFSDLVVYNPFFTAEVFSRVIELHPNTVHRWLVRVDFGADFLEKYNPLMGSLGTKYSDQQLKLRRTASRQEWLEVLQPSSIRPFVASSNDKSFVSDVLHAEYKQTVRLAVSERDIANVSARHLRLLSHLIHSNDVLTVDEKVEIFFTGPSSKELSPTQIAADLLVQVKTLNNEKQFIDAMLQHVDLLDLFHHLIYQTPRKIVGVVDRLNSHQLIQVREHARALVGKVPADTTQILISCGLVPAGDIPVNMMFLDSSFSLSSWEKERPFNAQLVDYFIENNMDATSLTLFSKLVENNDIDTIETVTKATVNATK